MKKFRTPKEAAKLDKDFSSHGRDDNPSSPYKYSAHNSPLKDYQNNDGSYGNFNRSSDSGGSSYSSGGHATSSLYPGMSYYGGGWHND